jgi:hypothetical protein
MQETLAPSEVVHAEIERLMQALETLSNPGCCRGAGVSVFQVMGRDGRPTGEEVRLCNGCGRDLSDEDA